MTGGRELGILLVVHNEKVYREETVSSLGMIPVFSSPVFERKVVGAMDRSQRRKRKFKSL